MSALELLRAQAYNNAWANHRLLNACSALPADALAAPRIAFFASIIHTLNHILTVDWFYVSALEGACVGYAAFDPEIPCPDIADLDREQRAVDQRLIRVCESLTDVSCTAPVSIVRSTVTQTERADRTLLHLFQHQIHHRAQVHTMLSGTAIEPPQLDEFFLESETDRALRRPDFEALGFSEASIWRARSGT
ncbi:MAG: damage-inducible protein DinB [Gammaproteobacteria bacterium]|nr:damage-inducible protein DinB [Gammaproteobacteria bacterium]